MSTTDKQTNLTAEEAITIIEREIACVNKECNIERACGQCELAMPSKEPIIEAYKLAIEALKAKPCTDAISREEALKEMQKYHDDCAETSEYTRLGFETAMNVVKELPPVMPQPKIGHWILLKDAYGDVVEAVCSCCDKNGNHEWSLCPYCGAIMVKQQESEE